MKKRFLAVLLALVLCMGLAVPAFAADSDFVIENGVLIEYIGPGSQFDESGSGGDIIIPDGVTEIGEYAFLACTASSITIPDGVTTIGERAFEHAQVPNINIPNSVTQIGTTAFYHCDLLTSVTIPGGVTTITEAAFVLCNGLTSVTICDGVAEIGSDAFASCVELASVTIPGSVTTIGEQAFYYCKSLTNVTIPSSVTSIGEDAFGECDSLTIHGEAGSYAEQYAKENNIPFSAVPGTTPAFTDVTAKDWYAGAVNWAVEMGYVNGVGNNRFAPLSDCTHVQILTMLYRADRGGDVAASADDMDKAVSWAREKGMIGDSFDPNDDCTRADAVKYIWQALGKQSGAAGSFADVSPDADYAAAVDWAVELGITDGTGGNQFTPDKVCNRGTIATFLHRAYVPEARLK